MSVPGAGGILGVVVQGCSVAQLAEVVYEREFKRDSEVWVSDRDGSCLEKVLY